MSPFAHVGISPNHILGDKHILNFRHNSVAEFAVPGRPEKHNISCGFVHVFFLGQRPPREVHSNGQDTTRCEPRHQTSLVVGHVKSPDAAITRWVGMNESQVMGAPHAQISTEPASNKEITVLC